MRSKLFEQRPKTAKTSAERWVRILPDQGEGYPLFDPLQERFIGRILFDADDNWIYDGDQLTIHEQEDLAGFITGHQKEMDNLIAGL
jgi:hypothetical protein